MLANSRLDLSFTVEQSQTEGVFCYDFQQNRKLFTKRRLHFWSTSKRYFGLYAAFKVSFAKDNVMLQFSALPTASINCQLVLHTVP